MRRNRVRFIPMFGRQSFKVDGKHHFYGGVNIEAVGGGWGLVDQLIKRPSASASRSATTPACASCCRTARARSPACTSWGPTATRTSTARHVVLACGGFEANPEMRVRYLGPGWELVPGARHALQHRRRHARRARDRRAGLRRLVDLPRGAVGHQRAAVRRPRGARQLPEALLPDRHHRQPGRRALRRRGRRLPQPHLRQVRPRGDEAAAARRGADLRRQDHRHGARRVPHQAGDQGRGADARGAGREARASTPRAWRARCASSTPPAGRASTTPRSSTACRTKGITPPKSNWALPIDKPPYTGFVVTCGITFIVRRPAHQRAAARCRTRATAPSRASMPPASSSAASSTRTTSAAPASCRARCSAASPARAPAQRALAAIPA